MKLDKLILAQICQHEYLEWEFPTGITGIFGPNGRGKSNALKLAYANLTGDFSRNPGTKADNIRDLAPETARSYVEAYWQHTTPFKIVRSLRPDNHRMEIGGRVLTKASEIQRQVEDVLGISRQLIDNYIFVPQWQIAEFMSARPADRAKVFAHLCNTVVAERLYELLGDQITSDAGLVSVDQEDLGELQIRIKKLKAEILVAQEQSAKSRQQILAKAERTALKETLQHAARRQQLRRGRRKKQEDLRQWQTAYNALAQEARKLQKHLVGIRQHCAQAGTDAEAAKLDLAKLKEAQGQLRRRRAIDHELEQNPLPELPEPPEWIGEAAQLREQYEQYRFSYTSAEALQSNLRAGVDECPTCGAPVREKLATARITLKQLVRPLAELKRKLAAIDAYTQEALVYKEKRPAVLAHRTSLQLELANLSHPEQLPAKTELEAVLTRYGSLAAKLQGLEARMAQYVTQRGRMQGQREQIREDRASILAELATITITKDDFKAAKQKLSNHARARSEYEHQELRLTELQERLAESQQRWERAQTLRQQATRAQGFLEHLNAMRRVVHRDCLPRVVADSYLHLLGEHINRNLEDFDSPFRVRTNEGLSFVVQKRHGRERGAEWLSGGEMVVLAIAFRVAVNSLFASQIGMMVLDEPTAGLDAHNLECLESALLRLAQLTKNRGHQIVMITHEDKLERVFDHVIRI